MNKGPVVTHLLQEFQMFHSKQHFFSEAVAFFLTHILQFVVRREMPSAYAVRAVVVNAVAMA